MFPVEIDGLPNDHGRIVAKYMWIFANDPLPFSETRILERLLHGSDIDGLDVVPGVSFGSMMPLEAVTPILRKDL